jgi:hypothetical protein
MKLDAPALVAYAGEIARAFGIEATFKAAPRNDRERVAMVRDLAARLSEVCPIAGAGSVGEALAALATSRSAPRGPARRTARQLRELEDLVGAATYARTKRAERGRIFALLLIVFDLVPLVGPEVDAHDPEETLKNVRRARARYPGG